LRKANGTGTPGENENLWFPMTCPLLPFT